MYSSSMAAIALVAMSFVVACSDPSSPATAPMSQVQYSVSAEAASRSEGAFAFWEYADAGGCVVTRIGVSLGHDISASVAAVGVYLERYDTCTPDGWTFLIGGNNGEGQPLTPSEFRIEQNLDLAWVRTTVTDFFDVVSGSFQQVELDLTWTATGKLEIGQNQHVHYNQHDPRLLINQHELQHIRPAVARGAVVIGSLDYATDRLSQPDLITRSNSSGVTVPAP